MMVQFNEFECISVPRGMAVLTGAKEDVAVLMIEWEVFEIHITRKPQSEPVGRGVMDGCGAHGVSEGVMGMGE